MTKLAEALTEVFQGVARVDRQERSDDGRPRLVLRTDLGCVHARRAVSCLVEPLPGDSVLYASVTSGDCFILAVLERELGTATTVSAEGDLRIQLSKGRFCVAAQDGIALVSAKDVEVAAPTFAINVGVAAIAIERLSYLGSLAESLVDRVFHRVRRSHRDVAERDEVRAGAIDYVARESVNLRGENTLVTAEEIVKIDAKQIIVG